MKLNARDALAFFARPDPSKAGVLIYGADAMRVALRRQEVIAALLGPNGEDEMRLTRLSGADLRKDPTLVIDALKTRGFFPGPRVVFVEEAGDGNAPMLATALQDWQPDDGTIVVTAGQLNARSALRKLFEDQKATASIGLYDDPPSQAEIDGLLSRAGLTNIDRSGAEAMSALGRALDPGDFRQLVEKVALFKLGDTVPLTAAEVAKLAPASTEAEVDDILNVVADGKPFEIGPVMSRLASQGAQPVTLLIMATRHFRALHAAASDPGGAVQGIARARPPIFGPRRDRMLRQAQSWGSRKLEQALQMILDTDLALRSAGQTAPQLALVERTFIRLAMLARH